MSSFLLLEVLLALSLVTLCALPLLRPHFDLAAHWAKSAREIERSLAADQIFERVRLMCFDQEIGWKELDYKRKVFRQVGDAQVVAQWVKKYRKTNWSFRLLSVTITLDGASYDYELYIERKN